MESFTGSLLRIKIYGYKNFSEFRIILLSSSPRRISLMRAADISFTAEINHGNDEKFDPLMEKSAVPEYLAKTKIPFLRQKSL